MILRPPVPKKLKWDLRRSTRAEVLPLFEQHHGYKSLGSSLTYCFAVYEDGTPVAAFVWQPPPPGAAKSVCPEAPAGVLALSRMVAVPKAQRRLKHISKPLRYQMHHLIDRSRWPALVTYSDEGEGHNGYVYQCSGWTATTRAKRPVSENELGERVSAYSNGAYDTSRRVGTTWIQRWEHWVCPAGLNADEWMARYGWRRVAVEGKTWSNGSQRHTWVRSFDARSLELEHHPAVQPLDDHLG